MAMTPFIISQCKVLDGPDIIANSIPAFWVNPNWVLAWPHRTLDEHIALTSVRSFLNLLTDRHVKRHQIATDPDGDKILGYARWVLPNTHMENPDGTPTWPEAQVPAVEPDDEAWFRRLAMAAVWDPRNVDAELAARTQQVKEIMTPKTPHITLEYIAVHPENQGMGIGTALVKSGMDQADKLGLDIFVHAFEEGCPLYKKMGFRLLAEFIQDYSQCGGTKRCGAYFYLYEHGSRGASV